MGKNIAVIGTGYVGLVSSVGLADFGNDVVGVDLRKEIVDELNAGRPTIYEIGLEGYLQRNLEAGRLSFTTDSDASIRDADIVFLAVGTPPAEDGSADLSYVETAARTIAGNLNHYKVIVTKSTVPVGTNRSIQQIIAAESGQTPGTGFSCVSNPEFLREGKAVQDFFHPDRIVVGCEDDRARSYIEEIYRALYLIQTPFVWCNLETAELIKYASNAFLATKISFINEMANLAEAAGADIHVIAKSMGMDGRISPKFLHPGPGYGGSCFPKDTKAIAATGDRLGVEMSVVKAVIDANAAQKRITAAKLVQAAGGVKGKTVAVLGLAFKAETDDVRESPALEIVEHLRVEGATVRAYDPQARDTFAAELGDAGGALHYCTTAFDALTGADAAIVLTEWNEFRNLDLERARSLMAGNVLFDARNVLDPMRAREAGFSYLSVGR